MKRKLSLAALAVLGTLMLVVLSGVPLPYAAHAQASPSVAIDLSSTSVTEGTAITVTMSFSNLAEDSDRATTDYNFRADVKDSENGDADGCEEQAGGYGLGVDRKINLVDEDPETRAGTVSADCPAGDYTVRASISDSDGGELASATAGFSVTAPEPPASSDAALSGLALSGVTLEFDPATTTYTADVGNDLAETTVTPTVNHDGATYVVRLDGADDEDGIVPLAVGENAISVVVAAEDRETTETYTVTVTRAEAATSGPTVAIALSPSDTIIEGEGTEIAVTLSFGNLIFDDDRSTTDYVFRADVKDSEDGDADGCEEQAGGYGLGVDRNINQVDEDPEIRRGSISADCPAGVYTLRASISADSVEVASATAEFYVLPPPDAYEVEEVEQPEEEEPVSGEQNTADATLSALTVSPTDIIGFDSGTTTYHVGVANSVTQATITASTTETNATIAWSTTDADSAAGHQVTLSAGLNTVTITVTAEDTTTEKAYTIHVGRGVTPAKGWKATDDFNGLVDAGHRVTNGIWSDGETMWATNYSSVGQTLYAYKISDKTHDSGKDFNTLDHAAGNTSPSSIWSDETTMWVADSFDDKIYAYKMSDKTRDSGKDFNTLIAAGNGHPSALWSDGTTMWVADSEDDKIYAYNLATKQRDAGKDFNTLADAGNTASRGIWSNGATMWVAELGNNTNNTLYAYNLETKERDAYRDFNTLTAAGNTDARGIWSDGATMWVADAGDDKIYSYNMWPQSDSNDATLSTLTVIPTDIIGFAGDTDSYHTSDSYHVGVANSVSQITITATANEANATIAWSSTDAGTAAGHQVTLSEGLNTVTITVTAEDTFTEKTYTIYVGRGVTTAFGWKATDDFNGLTPKFTGARGLWSDGETMWVTNDSFDKIDAYKMSDKTRDSGKDFRTLYDAEEQVSGWPLVRRDDDVGSGRPRRQNFRLQDVGQDPRQRQGAHQFRSDA